jgi:hypothetical protein
MTGVKKGLVVQVATRAEPVVSIKQDRDRVAEIERLVYATIPLLQWAAIYRPLQLNRHIWLRDIDNFDDPDYDRLQQKAREIDSRLSEIRETYIRNARAARVQAFNCSPGVRETLFSRFGLDYRETTGDSEADINRQWRHVVELCEETCPF